MGEEKSDKKENVVSKLEKLVREPADIARLFERDIKNILSNDERPIFYLNNENDIIYASNAAYKEVGYTTLRELNMSAATRARKGLNRLLNYSRAVGNINMITLDKLTIPTHDGKKLTILDLNIRVYNDITTVEIKCAKKKELIKQYKSKVDYTFKAPAYLDIVGPDDSVRESRDFIQDIVSCNVNKKDEDVLRIKMHRLTHLGDGMIHLFSNVLLEPNFKLYEPNQEIYEKLIANKFPARNIEGYVPPKPEPKPETLAIVPRTESIEYKLGTAL